MKIACLSFTSNGEDIAKNLKEKLEYDVDIYKKSELKVNLHENVEKIFKSYDGIVFISSTGIAVRLIAPFIKDKTKDPAVVVVDDLGRFSISLLSGHIGGANFLAEEISAAIGATPVVTTASDGRGIEAVDMFAKRNGLLIESMEDAKNITAMMVEGRKIGFISEIDLGINYKNIVDKNPEGCIIVTSKKDFPCEIPCCILRPRILNLGVGCRRGKTKGEILELVYKVFDENNLSVKSIKSIGSIDIKADEVGIIETAKELGCEFKTFSREVIEAVEDKFEGSSFVKSRVGVKSVAEPCAYLLGGKIIIKKTAGNGVTTAVSKEV